MEASGGSLRSLKSNPHYLVYTVNQVEVLKFGLQILWIATFIFF